MRETNLVPNLSKTKFTVTGTKQMVRVDDLNTVNSSNLQRKIYTSIQFKITWYVIDKSYDWREHINKIVKEYHIHIVEKLKRILPFYVKKWLTESLVLSKLDNWIRFLVTKM